MVRLELDIKHVLVRANGSFRYRRIVPPQDQTAIGKKNWIATWKRGTPIETVRFEAEALARQHDRLLAEARGEVLSDAGITWAEEIAAQCLADPQKRYQLMALWHRDGRGEHLKALAAKMMPEQRAEIMAWPSDDGLSLAEKAAVNAIEHGGKYQPDTMVLTAALAHDNEHRGDRRQSKPYDTAVKSFVACQGDLDIATIKPMHVLAYIAARKEEGQKPGTINRRLASLRTLLNRVFEDFEYEGKNPFNKRSVPEDVAASDKRQPMNASHATLTPNIPAPKTSRS